MKEKWPYEDIVNLSHHVSVVHPPMSLKKRAAQFMPFAALTGYGAAVEESARVTEEKITLSEDQLEELNRNMIEALETGVEVEIKYFVEDEKKTGGSYKTVRGCIGMAARGAIRMMDGTWIKGDDVAEVRIV